MQSSLFEKYKTLPKPSANIRGPRDEMIQKFVDRLNGDRAKAGYKPWPPAFIASKLAHVPTGDLWHFYKECASKRKFGAWFKWALDPKNASKSL